MTLLALAACSGMAGDAQKDRRYPELARAILERQRENQLQQAWRGRPYDALLHTFGTPLLIMDVPGFRSLKTSVILYGILDEPSDCIDAFTVVAQGPGNQLTVADYFCR